MQFTKNDKNQVKKKLHILYVITFATLLIMGIYSKNISSSNESLSGFEIDQNTINMLNHISDENEKIIIVTPIENGNTAILNAYENIDNNWVVRYTSDAFLGRSGVSNDKMEGDGATPFGIYTFGRAFGAADDPGSILNYTKITENDVWVDDVNSKYYNQWNFMDNPDADWNSAELLYKYQVEYKYTLTINYNTDPIIPGKGSAIFLHVSTDRPTAGCISVPENVMVSLLRFVDENTKIAIMR